MPIRKEAKRDIGMEFVSQEDRDAFLGEFFPERQALEFGGDYGFYTTRHPVYRYITVCHNQVTLTLDSMPPAKEQEIDGAKEQIRGHLEDMGVLPGGTSKKPTRH